MTASRPFIKARAYTWNAEDRTKTPGIGLMHGGKIRAHLTYAEARALADLLHDMADTADTRHNERNN